MTSSELQEDMGKLLRGFKCYARSGEDKVEVAVAGTRTVEALPILISSSLGLVYTLLLADTRDIVLVVIFALIALRSGAAMFRSHGPEKHKDKV